MMNKLSSLAVLLLLAFLPACTATPDGDERDEPEPSEENLGETHQAFCAPALDTPPAPVATLVGWDAVGSSGDYDYGNGECNGWTVLHTGLSSSAGPQVEASLGDFVGIFDCFNTTVSLSMWARKNGGPWSFRGKISARGEWVDGRCRAAARGHVSEPSGIFEAITKVQSRTVRSTHIGGVPATYSFNRPVTAKTMH